MDYQLAYVEEITLEDQADLQRLAHTLIGQAPCRTVVEKKYQVVLYIRPKCPYCIKVMRALQSINKTIPIKDIGQDHAAREELIQVGGKKQVPCLFINGKPLYESDQIINWLKKNKKHY